MKTSTLAATLVALALVLFGGHAMSTFGDAITTGTASSTSTGAGAVTSGFDAAFSITDN